MTTSRRIVHASKGILAAAVIAAILLVVPILLFRGVGFSYPDEFSKLTDPVTSNNVKATAALRLGLSMLAWLAWLQIAWALVVELVASVRGKSAGQVKALLPGTQLGARRLVATAMLLLSLAGSGATPSTGAEPVPTAEAAEPAADTGTDGEAEPSDSGEVDESTIDPAAEPTVDSVPGTVADGEADGDGDGDGDAAESDAGSVDTAARETADTTPKGADDQTAGDDGADDTVESDIDRALKVNAGSGGPITVQPSATEIDLGDYDLVDYTVRPGDTFWSVAEGSTGNGLAWRQIRQLNVGLMIDGLNLTENTDSLTPGWIIKVPVPRPADPAPDTPDEHVPLEPPPSSAEGLPTAEVKEGDHFWKLATETLSNAWGRQPSKSEVTPYWVDMVAANGGRLLPPEDPNLVYPGQRLELPPVPDDPVLVAAEPDGNQLPDVSEPPAATGGVDEAGVGAAADQGEELTQAEKMATITSTYASAAQPGAPDSTIESRNVDDFSSAADEENPLDEVALAAASFAAFGLLAAGVARIVDRRQLRQIGARRPGTAPVFSPPQSAKDLFSVARDDAALDDLDVALRHLGAATAQHAMAMPEMVGALVADDNIKFLMADRYESAPPPFTEARDGMIWCLDRPIPALADVWAANPYPSVVSAGYTVDDRLLIDLEYVQALHMEGELSVVVDSMATMALELATSPLADAVEVICVGFGEELVDLERVTVVPDLGSIMERVERHAAGALHLAASTDMSAAGARAAEVGDWTPMVVFDPLALRPELTAQLVAAANSLHGAGVSAVVTHHDGAGLTMEVSDDRVSIPAYRVMIERRAMTSSQRAEVVSAVVDAYTPEVVEHPDLAREITAGAVERRRDPVTGQGLPIELEQPFSDGPASRYAPPSDVPEPKFTVKLLGPLRVLDSTGEPVMFDRSATPEFIAYLAHHRNGVEVPLVMDALWPATTARRPWINNVFADARRSLGEGFGGVAIDTHPEAGDWYLLSPSVVTDIEVFADMVAQAEQSDMREATELLIEALELVDGIPYANITSRWPRHEGHWSDVAVMVDEASRSVAALALDQFTDPSLAEWATARGLLANPYSVELHRLRLRAAMASGSTSNVDAVFQHYQTMAMADDHRPEGRSGLDADIIELYESYRRSQMSELT